MKKIFSAMLLTGLAISSVHAATVIKSSGALSLAVPDGDPSGLTHVLNVAPSITSIDSVTVTLEIGGTNNGDLYAYIQHASGIAILLNRSGRTAGDSFGYGDDGYMITLSDAALNNIHTYQDQTTPLAGNPLTGAWQPDGRNIDPDLVLDTDTPTAKLDSFIGQAAEGDWTLFVADLSGGDTHTLTGWSIEIVGVPEPGTVILLWSALLLAARRRRTPA